MIKITIVRSEAQAIVRFLVCGHADYDERGKDIVCSGVSAVTVGTVNAIEKLTSFQPKVSSAEGRLAVLVPISKQSSVNANIQLLLEGMLVSLHSIQEEYKEYVTINEIIEGKGGL